MKDTWLAHAETYLLLSDGWLRKAKSCGYDTERGREFLANAQDCESMGLRRIAWACGIRKAMV